MDFAGFGGICLLKKRFERGKVIKWLKLEKRGLTYYLMDLYVNLITKIYNPTYEVFSTFG